MVEIKRILFCHDFSETADFAFPYAILIAEKFSAPLYIIHVVEESFQHWTYMEPFFAGDTLVKIFEEIEKKVREQLEDICKSMATMLKGYYPIIAKGIPFSEIIHTANEKKIDLIIMGTHGRTGLGRVLFGSVAQRVVRRATCPVLTVRMPAKESEGH
ncbi:MAG: universal stress protein [Thermodesulfobacteriota bacterium]